MQEKVETKIVLSLRRIVRAIEQDSRKLSSQFNTTPAQILALRGLLGSEGRTLASLAEHVGLSSSTMVGVIDRLERKGLVIRNRGLKDRRAVSIIITQDGVTYLQHNPKLLQDKLVEHLSQIHEDEKHTILVSLKKISAIFEADNIDASPVLDSGTLV
jgi:DNA-binding MarR family transcriptional regulator